MDCKNQENHETHICRMKVAQKFDDVKKLGKDADYFCVNCEAPSNNPDNLCKPKQYEGKAGVLKWKM